MLYLFVILLSLVIIVVLFMQKEQFGKLPDDESLLKIVHSKNYAGKSFKNISHTPDLTEGVSLWTVLYEFIFKKGVRKKPAGILPSVKTNLKTLNPEENLLIWFGHSSYFMQLDGRKMLVDPVFSGAASPVSFTTKSFAGSDVYAPDDFPEIDYLFISHDHWDHLDYKTIKAMKPKIKHIICGLGVAAHLKRWGFDASIISEKDWDETVELETGFIVNTTSGRHFSGRGFKRNQSLWMSYVLTTPSKRVFIGGDSGYDKHFKEIGEQFGPFDWVVLECGQYDKNWKYIHMQPEEVVQAALDLKATTLLPVHWAKFSLGNHAWDDSIIRVSAAAAEHALNIKTPMIGSVLSLDDLNQETKAWWQGMP